MSLLSSCHHNTKHKPHLNMKRRGLNDVSQVWNRNIECKKRTDRRAKPRKDSTFRWLFTWYLFADPLELSSTRHRSACSIVYHNYTPINRAEVSGRNSRKLPLGVWLQIVLRRGRQQRENVNIIADHNSDSHCHAVINLCFGMFV